MSRCGWALLLLAGSMACASGDAPEPPRSGAAGTGSPGGTQAAESPGGTPTGAILARISADSAWAALERQVGFGPRVPGTPAHERCGDWLVERLTALGAVVEEDRFSYRDREGHTWPLRNILGRMGPEGGNRLLLVAHWDTRPWADRDPDPAHRDIPIPGANDGASGVAVLLETVRVLRGAVLGSGVDILFADGEDLGREGDPEGYCRGSRRFAQRPLDRYRYAVVVDLVGDRDLRLPVEQYSLARAPEIVDRVWQRGLALSPEVFERRVGPAVFDDHVPLLDAGLPAVDIIDMEYPAWHTLRDDLSAVSAGSLVAVARVTVDLALRP